MKKTLLALGVGLLLSTSALAQNWDYATGRSAPQYGTYQRSVVRPTTSNKTSPVRRDRTNSPYRIGNPLYHPTAGQVLLTGEGSYEYTPRKEEIGQEKETGWALDPEVEIGLTNKLSTYLRGDFTEFEVKSGYSKGRKLNAYEAEAGLRYLLASADGFDFNINAGLYYNKNRIKNHRVASRNTGTDVGFLVGKTIQSITPYFGVGFLTDFWSKRGSSSGTHTYINPGVYINLTKYLGLNVDYRSVVHGDAQYEATFDVYPARNLLFRFGGFVIHPETDPDTYGAKAGVKVAF